MFSSRWIGIWADKKGKYPVFARMAVVSLLPILVITHLTSLPLPLVLLTTTLFMVSVSGRFVPAMALITSSTTSEHRGGFMSLNSSIHQAAAGCAAMLAGAVLSNAPDGRMVHFNRVGVLACLFTLLSLWLASRVREREEELEVQPQG